MDSAVRRKLADFIREKGVALADDPQRVKALLLDTCPEARTEVGLLVTAAEDEIPMRLLRSSDPLLRDGEISRAIVDLQQSRRLDRPAAEWIVHSWAWALGIVDREPSDNPEVTPERRVSGGPLLGVAPSGQAGAGECSNPAFAGPAGSEGMPPFDLSVPGETGRPTGPVISASLGYGPGGAAGYAPSGHGPTSGDPSFGPGGRALIPQPIPTVPVALPMTPVALPMNPPAPGPSVEEWPGVWPLPPARRPNRTGLWLPITIAVAAAIGLLMSGVLIYAVVRQPDPPLPPPSSSVVPSPSASTPTEQTVSFTVMSELADWEDREISEVYIGGRKLAELRISRSDQSDRRTLTIPQGVYPYELAVTYWYTDNGVSETRTRSGQGQLIVTAGATFRVYFDRDVVSLREVE